MNKLRLAGCALIRDDSILLLYRTKRNWYELPGGKIDEGENAQEAAVRELKEELCCSVTIVRRLGEKEFGEDGFVVDYVWFLAQINGESPLVGEPDKFSHGKWIPLKDLEKYSLSPNMKNFVEQVSFLSE